MLKIGRRKNGSWVQILNAVLIGAIIHVKPFSCLERLFERLKGKVDKLIDVEDVTKETSLTVD